MPFVQIETSSGLTNVGYTISTPRSASATSIEPELPTVLFLHPVFIGSVFWHPQFSDPKLRRFNLVAVDMRGHGDTAGSVPPSFGQMEATDDVIKFMNAIDLPPCFIVGLSIGTVIAVETAIRVPQRVLGLFLMSSMGTPEPPDTTAGRDAMRECWEEAFQGEEPDIEAGIRDAMVGVLELSFSGDRTDVSNAMLGYVLNYALKHYAPPNVYIGVNATLVPVTERTIQPDEDLQKIKCPVKLYHPENDVGYPFEEVETFYKRLVAAGVSTTLDKIPGAPHFVSVTHPEIINSALLQFVRENANDDIPPAPESAVSPWEAILVKYGLGKQPDVLDESSSDDDGSEVVLEGICN